LAWQTQVFSSENKVAGSEAFIPKYFLDHKFLCNVFKADYAINKAVFQVFLVQANKPDENWQMLKTYLEWAKMPVNNITDKDYLIDDSDNGKVYIRLKNNYLFGVVAPPKKSIAIKMLDKIESQIIK
jgi:hypothetical protein